jgi:hypothetical protein
VLEHLPRPRPITLQRRRPTVNDNLLTTEAELLDAIRRLAFGALDDRDAMCRIRDLFRDYDEMAER